VGSSEPNAEIAAAACDRQGSSFPSNIV
jgi:hypothetical protein